MSPRLVALFLRLTNERVRTTIIGASEAYWLLLWEVSAR
jgi:hypothetical protein